MIKLPSFDLEMLQGNIPGLILFILFIGFFLGLGFVPGMAIGLWLMVDGITITGG